VASVLSLTDADDSSITQHGFDNQLSDIFGQINVLVGQNPTVFHNRSPLCTQTDCCVSQQLLNEIAGCLFFIETKLRECLAQVNFSCGGAQQIIQNEIAPFFVDIEDTINTLVTVLDTEQANVWRLTRKIRAFIDENHEKNESKIAALTITQNALYANIFEQIAQEQGALLAQANTQKQSLIQLQGALITSIIADCITLKQELLRTFFGLDQQVAELQLVGQEKFSKAGAALFAAQEAIIAAIDGGAAHLAGVVEQQECDFLAKIKRLLSTLTSQLGASAPLISTNAAIQTDGQCQRISQLTRQQARTSNQLIQKLVEVLAIFNNFSSVTVGKIADASAFLKRQTNDQTAAVLCTMATLIPTLITQVIDCKSGLYNAICEQAAAIDYQILTNNNAACLKLQSFEIEFSEFLEKQIALLNNQTIGKMGTLCTELATLDAALRSYKALANSHFSCVQQGIQTQLGQKLSTYSTDQHIGRNKLLIQLTNTDLTITGQLCQKLEKILCDLTEKNNAILTQISFVQQDKANNLSENFLTLNSILTGNSNSLCTKLATAQTVLSGTLNNTLAQLLTDLTARNTIISQKLSAFQASAGSSINNGLANFNTDLFVQGNSLCADLGSVLTDVTVQSNSVSTKISTLELVVTATLLTTIEQIDNRVTMLYSQVQDMILALDFTIAAILVFLLV